MEGFEAGFWIEEMLKVIYVGLGAEAVRNEDIFIIFPSATVQVGEADTAEDGELAAQGILPTAILY